MGTYIYLRRLGIYIYMYIVVYVKALNVLCERKGAKLDDDYEMKSIDIVRFHGLLIVRS